MKSHDEQTILEMLKNKQYKADEFGRVTIDDPEIAELIKGSQGTAGGGVTDALWNGGCSNGSCH